MKPLAVLTYGTLCAAFIEGCGPARPMPLPAENGGLPKGGLAQPFESKKTGPETLLPLALYPRSPGNVLVTENQIVFTHPFPHRGQGFRFVWPQEFLGSLIVQGTVTYRIWTATNQGTADLAMMPIRFDSIQNHWFVVISEVLGQRAASLAPDPSAETQVFVLEVSLANHARKVIEIRFRIQE